MDFWSRLIGGSRSATPTKPLRTNSPVERLTAFKRTCNTLQQLWRTSTSPSGEVAATLHARNCLERLNNVLSDESRAPAPHPCLAFAATSQIYVTVTKLALAYHDPLTIRAAAVFFNTLIDGEVDGIVDSRIFARALVDLVRRAVSAGEEEEGRLVELLFGVANNIRLRPHILSAWFVPKTANGSNGDSQAENGKEFAGATRTEDFPLFYVLVDYVHHDGRAGDFARTGLLYLIETASKSKDLERWMIESDLATFMATGLGALYSQLSRKLQFSGDEAIPNVVALSDHQQPEPGMQPQLGAHMDAFLSYLLFWQDTVDHCKSTEVNATLLDHFQILFLQQLLYPSLLESSDVDGGSTSAVITYLYRILESIDQPELIYRILHFLLAAPSEGDVLKEPLAQEEQKLVSLSRRKSLNILASLAEAEERPSPSLFNLVDLILMSIRSKNRQTVVATLRLITIILRRHHSFAGSLIKLAANDSLGEKSRTVGSLNAELGQLFGMATSIIDDPVLEDSYEAYLRDSSTVLESRLYIVPPSGGYFPDGPVDRPLVVRPDDAVLQEIIALLGSFFTNSVVVNLALTDTITGLASSNLVSLDGWLLVEPRRYTFDSTSSKTADEAGAEGRSYSAYKEPTLSTGDAPIIPAILYKLVSQIEKWRQDIADFDVLIAARREILHSDSDDNDRTVPSRQPSEAAPRSSMDRPLQRAVRVASQSGSPRGRQRKATDVDGQSVSTSIGSPLREPSMRDASRGISSTRSLAADDLRKRLTMPFKVDGQGKTGAAPERVESEAGSVDSLPVATKTETGGATHKDTSEEVSLGHVLTNTVILYEFILELASIVQVRATLFQEVGFA